MSSTEERYYRKAKQDVPPSLSMNEDMLSLLCAIEDEHDIKKLQHKTKMPMAAFKKSFLELVSLGLIEECDAEEVYADWVIIEKMKYILNQIDGLPGDIVLDETSELLRLDLDRIPLTELPFFIERVSDQIPNKKNQYMFKKWMLQDLKDIGFGNK